MIPQFLSLVQQGLRLFFHYLKTSPNLELHTLPHGSIEMFKTNHFFVEESRLQYLKSYSQKVFNKLFDVFTWLI